MRKNSASCFSKVPFFIIENSHFLLKFLIVETGKSLSDHMNLDNPIPEMKDLSLDEEDVKATPISKNGKKSENGNRVENTLWTEMYAPKYPNKIIGN